MSAPSSLPSTAKAVQIAKTGGVDVFEYKDVPVPSAPGPGQLLVRNRFAGVNYRDTYFRTGLYAAPVLPLILGHEAAGEVVAAAPDASPDFPPGTRVAYIANGGTYAEYTVVSAATAVAVPDGLELDKAAAVLLQGLTAWIFIREAANVQPGQWTLVHAAAGGVGLLLVQMLRIVGAKVIGTASSEEKRELARKNGAGWTLDSRSDDMVARVKEITDGHGVDVIFDGVGKATFDAGLEMIAIKGHFISFGNAVSTPHSAAASAIRTLMPHGSLEPCLPSTSSNLAPKISSSCALASSATWPSARTWKGTRPSCSTSSRPASSTSSSTTFIPSRMLPGHTRTLKAGRRRGSCSSNVISSLVYALQIGLPVLICSGPFLSAFQSPCLTSSWSSIQMSSPRIASIPIFLLPRLGT